MFTTERRLRDIFDVFLCYYVADLVKSTFKLLILTMFHILPLYARPTYQL